MWKPLSEVRTLLVDFFSIQVEAVGVMSVRQSITIMCAGGGSESGGRYPAIGVDGRPVRLHLVDGNVMGREFSRVVTCLTGNDAPRNKLRGIRRRRINE